MNSIILKQSYATVILLMVVLVATQRAFAEREITGNINLSSRSFLESHRWNGQDSETLQVALSGNVEFRWQGDQTRLSIIPSARYDATDDERSIVDLSEAYWALEAGNYELLVGINTVFWGVAESVHLVDIINQTDAAADIDGEDKLGQPMINLELQRDWGRLSAYLLPYFRERTFAGEAGRLRTPIPVDSDNAVYQSGAEQSHLDVAFRYSHFFGDIDLGVSVFAGTSREPRFISAPNNNRLIPFYDQIRQLSIDLQYTGDTWLWKLEAITRETQHDTFVAAVGGFEYTFFQVRESAADIGVLLEAQYDNRASDEPNVLSDNDIFSGLRLALNDSQDTSLLAGLVYDWKTAETFINIEAERRIGESFLLELRSRLFTNVEPSDQSFAFAQDDYLELQVSWYF